MFAQTLWSAKGNMHHNLAQKLCKVLGKLRQLRPLDTYSGFAPGPHCDSLCDAFTVWCKSELHVTSSL